MKSILIAAAVGALLALSVGQSFDPCEKIDSCTLRGGPVCTVNGTLFANRCAFLCEKQQRPEVEFTRDFQVCTSVDQPGFNPCDYATNCPYPNDSGVCDSAGTLHQNRCSFLCDLQSKPELKKADDPSKCG